MSHRDKIRFIEIFKDYTIDQSDNKKVISIPKRENNPELSVFANLALDLIDFRDRVRPMADDMAMLDKSQKYQRQDAKEVIQKIKEHKVLVDEIKQSEK